MGDIAKMLLQYDAVKVLLLGFFLLFLLILFMIIRITYAPGKALYKGIKGSRKMEFEDFKESYLEDPDMFLLYEDEIWHLDKPVSEMNEEEKGIYDKAAARRSDGGDLIEQIAEPVQMYGRRDARKYVRFREKTRGPIPVVINVMIVILSLVALYLFMKVFFLRLGG